MKIAFINSEGKDLGSFTFEGGALSADSDWTNDLLQDWIQRKFTPDEIVEYFREWSNGYYTSYTVGEN